MSEKMKGKKTWSASVLLMAVTSASCGSLASVFGKIAFDNAFLDKYGINNWITKGLAAVLILAFNFIMLSLFFSVLQTVSALQASLLAFVCNYLISTVIGVVLFGEAVAKEWIIGAMLMTAGAIRIATGALKENNAKQSRKKKSA